MKRPSQTPVPMKDRLFQFLLGGLLLTTALMLVLLTQLEGWRDLLSSWNSWILGLETNYHHWFQGQTIGNSLLLLPLAYLGGLLASLSPCILSLLPINLSYIGTREIQSRWEALVKSSAFVLGVVTVLSALGLFSALAAWVMVGYRGYIDVAIGLLIIAMGLNLLGILHLTFPQLKVSPKRTASGERLNQFSTQVVGPYSVGLTFALLSSPCSSPVLFAFLAAAANTGSPLKSGLTMVCYALGYTTIFFMASLFTGLAKQSRNLLPYSSLISTGSSFLLIVLGGYYLLAGFYWIWRVVGLGMKGL